MAGLPAWPDEDHTCTACGLDYALVDVDDVPEGLARLAAQLRELITPLTAAQRTTRAAPDTWTVTEYLCHLRDVCEVTTIRLHRARVEDAPRVEPMYNDLRARRFRYAERDAVAVLDELDAAVAGCRDEIARVEDWDRTVARLPGETRTTRWIARQAVHEATHHLLDMRTVAGATPAE